MRLRIKKNRTALTFIEILVAVALLAILVSIVTGVSNYVTTQARTRLTENTIAILTTALEHYHDYWNRFPFEADPNYGTTELESDLGGTISSGTHWNEYASSEALYYFLSTTPGSARIISPIDNDLITNTDRNGYRLEITINGEAVALTRFIDTWKTSFRYTYRQGDNFPLIISAGPDKNPNTAGDNITSRGL